MQYILEDKLYADVLLEYKKRFNLKFAPAPVKPSMYDLCNPKYDPADLMYNLTSSYYRLDSVDARNCLFSHPLIKHNDPLIGWFDRNRWLQYNINARLCDIEALINSKDIIMMRVMLSTSILNNLWFINRHTVAIITSDVLCESGITECKIERSIKGNTYAIYHNGDRCVRLIPVIDGIMPGWGEYSPDVVRARMAIGDLQWSPLLADVTIVTEN